jgi:glutamate dehydrogenase
MATYRGPHGDAPGADSAVTAPVDRTALGLMSPALVDAHLRLGKHRSFGDTRVAVYAENDPAGFGPALQIVTDNASMLMDSVTVLLHRLGVAYKAIMNPVFRARRGPGGDLLEIEPASDAPFGDGVDETWIHVQLAESVDAKSVEEVKRLLPSVLADTRQVALDSTSMAAMLRSLAAELDSDPEGRFPGSDRKDVAALLRWLADGHFVLLGYQRCQVRDGQSSADPSSRLGVLRLRTDVLPQLTESDDLLVLAQATMSSYLRYGAHPYIVVVRERDGGAAIEHRFVGLFTVAAMNANVLEIPLISRRVNDALAIAHRDPSHPGQLLLDIIQTIPRSELFALSARELLDMAMAVVDLGSRRRTLLFRRADQLAHFVSCLVYLPRERYTTAVRLEMQDILVRELGG